MTGKSKNSRTRAAVALTPFQTLPDLSNPSINPITHTELLKMPLEATEQKKILRVAILGIPNSGKSTLINKLVGHHICPESGKPNTTRRNTRAILSTGDTQVIFVDTPGVVEDDAAVKFKMDTELLLDPEMSCRKADLLVVLQDVSNRFVRETLNKKVLRLLCLYYRDVPSILVLNKMDTIPKSRRVFDLIRKLTCNRLEGEQGQIKISKHDNKRSVESYLKRKSRIEEEEATHVKEDVSDILEIAGKEGLSEQKTSSLTSGLLGWPGFSDVFTVSALNGDGMDDLKEYLVGVAKPGSWEFPENVKFDDDPRNIVINIIKSKFLDHLPQAIPYQLNPEIQMWEIDENWSSLKIFATVDAKNKNQFQVLVGPGGKRIKAMSEDIQESLVNFFSHEVHFNLSVIPKFTIVVKENQESVIKPKFM